MTTTALDSAFGSRLLDAGFVRGAVSPERAIYVGEIVIERDADRTRDVIVTVTGGAFELLTFVAGTDRIGYRQLLAVRDDRDQYAQVEFEGSWVLRRRISAHPNDVPQRIVALVATGAIDMAHYAETITARLAADAALVARELTPAV